MRPSIPPEAARAARAQLDAMRAKAEQRATTSPGAVLVAAVSAKVDPSAQVWPAPRTRSGNNPVKVSCGCRSVRVFPSALALGPITCQACGSDFA